MLAREDSSAQELIFMAARARINPSSHIELKPYKTKSQEAMLVPEGDVLPRRDARSRGRRTFSRDEMRLLPREKSQSSLSDVVVIVQRYEARRRNATDN